jgi:hypothetical protein
MVSLIQQMIIKVFVYRVVCTFALIALTLLIRFFKFGPSAEMVLFLLPCIGLTLGIYFHDADSSVDDDGKPMSPLVINLIFFVSLLYICYRFATVENYLT